MDSTAGDTEEERGRSEANIRLVVNGVHQLDIVDAHSAVTHVQHLPWKLSVEYELNDDQVLFIYLICKYKPKSTSWWCRASADLTLVAQSNTGPNITRTIEYKFDSKKRYYAIQIPFNDFVDPEKGFIKDNTIVVEAKVSVEETVGVFVPQNVEIIIQRKNIESYPELAYFMNTSNSNVVFKVEGKPIPAVKEFLSFKCDYFRVMFSGNYTESSDKEIVMADTDCNAFKVIVWYLYSQELVIDLSEEICYEFMYEVYRLADMFHIKRLLVYFENQLKANINKYNLEFVARIGFEYKINSLTTCVKAFIDQTFSKLIVKDSDYLKTINKYTDDYVLKKTINISRKKVRIN